MVTLSDFIGELVTDIAKARSLADYSSAAISEQYHADPFVKNLPVPHYTIDEAEIEVPVMVVGISTQSEHYQHQKDEILETTKEKLPMLILTNYKWNYIRERELEKQKQEKEIAAEDSLKQEINKPRIARAEDLENFDFPSDLLQDFAGSAKNVTAKMVKHLEKYLRLYNYELLKLLDLSEDFSKELMSKITADIRAYKKDTAPYYTDAAVNRAANYIGNIMFFEFKKIMRSDKGVNIDISTGKMNQSKSGSADCLMHIKIKLKEQDLNLVVEERDGREKRYLSLT